MKTRIKMHEMPGSIGIPDKIRLMERKPRPGDEWRVKGFRKEVLSRERAVIKEQQRKEMKREE